MKHLLTLLATLAILVSPAAAQTIKSLGYNTTNGQIVAATNVVWTNAFSFSTNTVAAQVRTNLGLGATNNVSYNQVAAIDLVSENITIDGAIYFTETFTNLAVTRTNLSLGLPALTNTSNVTAMRALAGSTNTNQPFSGSISVVGTNNTNTLVFSNGILLSQ